MRAGLCDVEKSKATGAAQNGHRRGDCRIRNAVSGSCEWRVARNSGEWRAIKQSMANGRWQMADGKWQMANGKWQTAPWFSLGICHPSLATPLGFHSPLHGMISEISSLLIT